MNDDTISLSALKSGTWYLGAGRCGPCAVWSGPDRLFIGVTFSCGQWEVAHMQYGERGFSPYLRVE